MAAGAVANQAQGGTAVRRREVAAAALRSLGSDRTYLAVEFAVVFGIVPLALVFRAPGTDWVLLAGFAAATWWAWRVLRATGREDGRPWTLGVEWNAAGARRDLWRILGLFVVLGGGLTAATWVLAPEVGAMPREEPAAWLRMIVVYPLLSVIPQELIWRSLVYRRYRAVFAGDGAMLLASAAAFAWVHVLLENMLAVALCFVGGLLFGWTYRRTGSLAAASLEHALYGCLVFTIGLGSYFFLSRM